MLSVLAALSLVLWRMGLHDACWEMECRWWEGGGWVFLLWLKEWEGETWGNVSDCMAKGVTVMRGRHTVNAVWGKTTLCDAIKTFSVSEYDFFQISGGWIIVQTRSMNVYFIHWSEFDLWISSSKSSLTDCSDADMIACTKTQIHVWSVEQVILKGSCFRVRILHHN